jgi:hypothetical protein
MFDNRHTAIVSSMNSTLFLYMTTKVEEEEEDEYEDAVTQKPTCIEETEHLNALRCCVESISEVPQQIWKTLWDMENYIL